MKELFTIAEVAEILRVDSTTVRRWVKNGMLEAVTLPHAGRRQSSRIKRETLEKVLGEPVSEVISLSKTPRRAKRARTGRGTPSGGETSFFETEKEQQRSSMSA
jgi:excisionase family DNA binding protein